jgi:hypothetical protein
MLGGVSKTRSTHCHWKIEFSSQQISEYWFQTITLIPFLQAIKHFCNYILSYFMDTFAFYYKKRLVFNYCIKLCVEIFTLGE